MGKTSLNSETCYLQYSTSWQGVILRCRLLDPRSDKPAVRQKC